MANEEIQGAAINQAIKNEDSNKEMSDTMKEKSYPSGSPRVSEDTKQDQSNLTDTASETAIANLTAKYSDALTSKIDEATSYFDNKNLGDVMADVEKYARKNPTMFVGGAFLLGIIAARFLKSSPKDTAVYRRKNLSGRKT